jgi:hypothetical protein
MFETDSPTERAMRALTMVEASADEFAEALDKS